MKSEQMESLQRCYEISNFRRRDLYMSYEDLILLYPWIDLVLELFKGVMPTLVALLAIYQNNSFARKRELIYRKKNLQLDYYTKMLNWLHNIKNDMMEVSRDLDNALKMKPGNRKNRYDNFLNSISKMNTSIAAWKDTYSFILEIYCCDIELNQLKEDIFNCSNTLVEIGKQYINQVDTTMATDEINSIVGTSKKVIDECIRKLLKEMDALY